MNNNDDNFALFNGQVLQIPHYLEGVRRGQTAGWLIDDKHSRVVDQLH